MIDSSSVETGNVWPLGAINLQELKLFHVAIDDAEGHGLLSPEQKSRARGGYPSLLSCRIADGTGEILARINPRALQWEMDRKHLMD